MALLGVSIKQWCGWQQLAASRSLNLFLAGKIEVKKNEVNFQKRRLPKSNAKHAI